MNYIGLNKYDTANGDGIRVSLFVSGCTLKCKGCFNEESWDFNAGKPFTIETLNEKIGVSKIISSFTIPLGATINMDGTAIMQGVAVIFVAQAFGINLDFMDYITVIATATMASIGTAGVPGVGLITLSMVFASVGLPVEGIALIMGIDRILDMTRTAVNITGDAVCTTIVAYQNNDFNTDVFNDKECKDELFA